MQKGTNTLIGLMAPDWLTKFFGSLLTGLNEKDTLTSSIFWVTNKKKPHPTMRLL